MRFYFIRHGQSVNNAIYEATGRSDGRSEDPQLTEIGQQQARLLADFLRAKDAQASGNAQALKRDYFGFTHLYTSLTLRAVQTGTAVSEALNIPLVAWPEIHETGGIYLEDPASGELGASPAKPGRFFKSIIRNWGCPSRSAMRAGGTGLMKPRKSASCGQKMCGKFC